jgi:hypothetical protein
MDPQDPRRALNITLYIQQTDHHLLSSNHFMLHFLLDDMIMVQIITAGWQLTVVSTSEFGMVGSWGF